MDYYKTLMEFDIKPDIDRVLPAMECTRSSSIFPRIEALYQELYPKLLELIHPLGVIKVGAFPNQKDVPCSELEEAAYVLFTLGDVISDRIGELFLTGEFLEGMLLETMADDYLVRMEASSQDFIKDALKSLGRGAFLRLEAPRDIPMEYQKTILKEIKRSVFVPVTITDRYMYEPEKTLSYLLLLTEDTSVYNGAHSCDNCELEECMFKKHMNGETHI